MESKKQFVVSCSSLEAEYRDLVVLTCEVRYLLDDMRIITHFLAILYCDNQLERHIAYNFNFHEQMKHIDID